VQNQAVSNLSCVLTMWHALCLRDHTVSCCTTGGTATVYFNIACTTL